MTSTALRRWVPAAYLCAFVATVSAGGAFAAPGPQPHVFGAFAAPGPQPHVFGAFAAPGPQPHVFGAFAAPGPQPHVFGAFAARGTRLPASAALVAPGTRLPASAALAAPPAQLRVSFAPDRPGARTTVELSLRLLGAVGGSPPLRSLGLRLPAGMGVATTMLGEDNCAPASLIAAGLAGCPGNSVLGFGSATAVVPDGSRTVSEQADLHTLMGPPRTGELEVIFYVQASAPVFAQLVLPAVLAEDVPPYGERLQATLPLIEVWPEGPDLLLRELRATIGPLHLLYHRRVGGRTIAFKPQGIRIPRACPPGGYPFAAELGFADGTSATTSYRVRCPPH